MKLVKKLIISSLVITQIAIGHGAFAEAKAYDGVWFLGFNLKRPVTSSLKFRQAVSHALNRQSEEPIPGGVIPPGMNGSDPDLKPYKYNPKYAQQLMKNLPGAKNLVLLHTDGIKTIAIAKRIQKDLKQLGLKLQLEQVPYSEEEKWAEKLAAGKFDLFLMGYKAGGLTPSDLTDTDDLLDPLFKANGEANFMGYVNTTVGDLSEQISGLDITMKVERGDLFRKINRTIYKDIPVIGLFYIEKL